MKLAAIASRACFTARASRCCSLPLPLWSLPLLAALVGGLAGYLGGIWLRLARGFTDLFLSLPWLFLLITVRALLPLNVSPLVSVLITFLILGLLGWAASARVLSTSADALRNSDFVLQARASGLHGPRLFLDSCSAQSEARSVRAILDFDSGLHSERGQSRHPRPGRCRTAAFLGKPAARTGRLDFVSRRTVATGAVCCC